MTGKLTASGPERQTFAAARFEILIVSGGSTQESRSNLHRCATSAPIRTRLPFSNTEPLAHARNLAIEQAVETWPLFLSEDLEAAGSVFRPRCANHW